MHKQDNKVNNKALILVRQGKLNLAHKIIKKNKKKSTTEMCWLLLADICSSVGLLNEYKQCCQNAIINNQNFALAYSYMARFNSLAGNNQEALSFHEKAVSLEPHNSIIQYNFGALLRQLGMYEKAVVAFTSSLDTTDSLSNTHYMIASCFQFMGRFDLTEFHCLESLKHDSVNTDALVCLGFHYQNLGDYEQAIDYFNRAIKVSPDSKAASGAKASLLVRIGKKEKAYEIIRQAIDSGGVTSTIIDAYSSLHDSYGSINEVIKVAEIYLQTGRLSSRNISSVNFSLGMMYDEIKSYDKAFSCFKLANQANYINFDVPSYVKYTQGIINFYNVDYDSVCSKSTSNKRPVFIVGMPRSGTSLVEQILSMHSEVYAAGELTYISDIVKKISNTKSTSAIDIESIADCDDVCLTSYADEYINRVEQLSDRLKISTDKMPANYLYLGLIQQMFPEAIFLHCKRDPRDTCLSIYFQDFGAFQPFSNDLNNTARIHLEHDRLMVHWKNKLNMKIYDVEYEDMVNNFEVTVRGILEHCNLKWEDACLDFYTARRSVATASFCQVDKPIYNKSVARWKNYEMHIGGLNNILKPIL